MPAPALSGLDTVVFLENTVNATPQVIDSSVVFTDVDDDFNGGRLTVTGLLAEDTVSIRSVGNNPGEISYNSGTGEVSYGGVVFGVAVGGAGGALTITFDADATSAAIDALIENLTYANSSDTPTSSRTLTINVFDAAGHDIQGAFAVTQLVGAADPFDAGTVSGYNRPTVADLDGDGDLDLIVADGGGFVHYFENTGSATSPVFVEQTGAASPVDGINLGGFATSTLVDLDGDGDYDLFAGSYFGDYRYFENTGNAAAAVFTERTGGANPFDGISVGAIPNAAFADLDNDGDLDFVLGVDGAVTYFENTGSSAAPTFTQRTGASNPFDSITASRASPTFHDVDQDGDLDLLLGNFDGTVQYFENTGTASAPVFTERTGVANPFDGVDIGFNTSPVFADLDGDNDADVLLGTGDAIQYYQNTASHGSTVNVGVTAQTDTFTGDGAANVLTGTSGDDILQGLDGDDTLTGGDGNDRLRGGTGADAMFGGNGNDVYVVDNVLDTTDETGGSGTDTVVTRVTFTLATDIENLTLAAVGGAIDGTGNTLDNLITGNASANVLSGMDGNDTINADGGNDTVNGGDGADTLNGQVGDDTLYGDAGIDTLDGGSGNDTLDGGTGADVMTGGLGNDIYYVDVGGDSVTENAGEGTDEVRAAITYSLGANVENLTLTGGGDIDATGNALRNVITGNGGANTIHAGDEVDTVSGGDGNDTIYGEAGNDFLNGDNGADLLDGGDGDDTLNGGAGADYLRGGVGADRMSGGTGNDYYVVDNVGDTTDETGGDGTDEVISRITWTLRDGTENLTLAAPGGAINGTGNAADNVILGNSSANVLSGLDGDDNINGDGGADTLRGGNGADTLDGSVGNDTLYGDAGIDTLIGGWGNDILDGGTGADSMAGGLGNDTYYVDDTLDTITEGAGEGTDAVESSVTYTLAANVENLTLLVLAGNIDGTGSNVRNTIIGTRGDNVLHGMGDMDTLYGGNGADTLYGDDGNDVLYGENDNDTLYGGNGEDTLTGGGGSDAFVFTNLDIHRTGLGQSADKDKILDLAFNSNDRIDLSAIDANVNLAGDQAFTFVSKFTHVAGQATLAFSGGVTVLQLDVDGDGYADLRVEITGNHAATTTNLYTGGGDTNGGWVL